MAGAQHECPRRQFLLMAAAVATPLPGLWSCEQRQPPARKPHPVAQPLCVPDWMLTPSDVADADLMRDIAVIRELLIRHQEIVRTVEHFSYGIRATTTSADPDIAERISMHAEQMKSRLQRGAAIRQLDPLFAEIFAHHQQIDLEIEHLPNGIRVNETSSDPVTVMLIRQHAVRAVSEFAATGMSRAIQPTPLPDGYPR
jgi:light-regulated signal transduction histidine kinase (bacteriophytochrome)